MIPQAALRHCPHSIRDRMPGWLAPPRPTWEKTLDKVFDFIEKNWDILFFTVVGIAAGWNTGSCYFIALAIGMGAQLCSEQLASEKARAAIQLQAPGVLALSTVPLASIIAHCCFPGASMLHLGLEAATGGLAGLGGAFMDWR